MGKHDDAKPGLFASLTRVENEVLSDHLRSGWTKQHLVTKDHDGFNETAAVLDDLSNDWWARRNAGLD
jgi:hypothetical protein